MLDVSTKPIMISSLMHILGLGKEAQCFESTFASAVLHSAERCAQIAQ